MANRPGAPDERVHVMFEGVEIGFRNFSGRKGPYNANGDREFVAFLPRDVALDMANQGWKIKETNPREEGDEIRYYLPIKVELESEVRPAQINIITSNSRSLLSDPEMVSMIDYMEITTVDLSVRPYNWQLSSGAQGTKAYLVDAFITIRENPLQLKYGHLPLQGQTPNEDRGGVQFRDS